MFSATFSVIIAVGLISVGSGTFLDQKKAFEVAMKCTKAAWDADMSALTTGEGPRNEKEILEDACIYLREFARCIINANPADYELPDPNIVHFLVAYEWQHLYIAKKAGMCDNMPIDALKRIAIKHGIMEREQLQDIENDKYEECVGDAMTKCTLEAEYLMKEGISQDFKSAMIQYIKCYQKEGYRCDADMLHHYIATLKAYGKHLEEHGKMVDKLNLPLSG